VPLDLKRVDSESLKPRQQEGFNFQKVSAVLADYGYLTIRLTNDWGGADFIAQHFDGVSFLKVQLKGRLTFSKKYCGQDLYVCFRDGDNQLYLYPHDEVLKEVLDSGMLAGTDSWDKKGEYHFPYLKPGFQKMLQSHRLG
jgi:hypothetical protein